MRLLKIVKTDKYIQSTVEQYGNQSEDKITAETHEQPLPSFYEAFDALRDVLIEVFDVSATWAYKCEVNELSISYTEAETRSATLKFSRNYIGGKSKDYSTVSFKIDNPQGNEQEEREITENAAELVENMIKEAVAYIQGNRQQALLPLEDRPKADEDRTDGEDLPFEDDTLPFPGPPETEKASSRFSFEDLINAAETTDQVNKIVLEMKKEDWSSKRHKLDSLKKLALKTFL